jgi:hypothetical protein
METRRSDISIPVDLAGLLDDRLLEWLLAGDVSVQHQAHRYLLDSPEPILSALQARIPDEGFGRRFLDCRDPETGWWPGWYSPKWTSTHYTLLELRDIGFPGSHPAVREVAVPYVNGMWAEGAYNRKTRRWFDACVAAMLASIACFAGLDGTEGTLKGIIDYLLKVIMPDGGWNCGWWREPEPCVKSSVHTTISTLEALRDLAAVERERPGVFGYRAAERKAALRSGAELLLSRRIYRKLHADETIEPRFERMSFPGRWHFDFLRALLWFASVGAPYDPRMADALALLSSKRRKDGTWPLQERHAGRFHFDMEKTGGPSRWNTIRALRVLRAYREYA